MYWKSDFQQRDYKGGQFAKKQYRKLFLNGEPHILRNTEYRGVEAEKVNDILKIIGPFIPTDHIRFWQEFCRYVKTVNRTELCIIHYVYVHLYIKNIKFHHSICCFLILVIQQLWL